MADILAFPARRPPKPAAAPPADEAATRAELEEIGHIMFDLAERAMLLSARILDLTDRMDGDPDLEDGADAEPSLGAPEGHDSQVVWLRGGDRDIELDHHPELHP